MTSSVYVSAVCTYVCTCSGAPQASFSPMVFADHPSHTPLSWCLDLWCILMSCNIKIHNPIAYSQCCLGITLPINLYKCKWFTTASQCEKPGTLLFAFTCCMLQVYALYGVQIDCCLMLVCHKCLTKKLAKFQVS